MTKSELIKECLRMNDEIFKKNRNIEFMDGTIKNQKELIARYEFRVDELVEKIEWLKQMNKGLVELSMKVLRGVNNEKQCDY